MNDITWKVATWAGCDFSGWNRLLECSDCFALIHDKGKEGHLAWHARLTQRENAR